MRKRTQHFILLLAFTLTCGFYIYQPTFYSLLEFYQQEEPLTIIEPVDNFSSLQSYIDNNTIVLFDLDDTTFTSTSFYGSTKFFVKMMHDKISQENLSQGEAKIAIYPEWIESQKQAVITLTDEKIPAHMDTIRKKGIMIYGFTARRPELSETTINQLNKLGIKFDNHPEKFSLIYKNQLNETLFDDSEARFVDGVLFCHESNEKGKVFKEWYKWLIRQTGRKYTKVLLIDDTERNIASMKEAAKDLRLSYVGLLYKTKYLFESH